MLCNNTQKCLNSQKFWKEYCYYHLIDEGLGTRPPDLADCLG